MWNDEPKRRHKLRKLKLRRISLVESPANESARVVLLKSAPDKPEPPSSALTMAQAVAHGLMARHPGLSEADALSAYFRACPEEWDAYRAEVAR